jgi:cysteine-rich repeat protein
MAPTLLLACFYQPAGQGPDATTDASSSPSVMTPGATTTIEASTSTTLDPTTTMTTLDPSTSTEPETPSTSDPTAGTTDDPACGNGVCDPGEDPNGCAEDCPPPPSCGDGALDPGEACDDANQDSTDACLATCLPADCGDGFVYVGVEACDDGDITNDDDYGFEAHCNATCQGLAPHCGDAVCQVDQEDAIVCAADCEAVCGDGFAGGAEACDDGDGAPAESPVCNDDCTLTECGDGKLNEAAGEVCDDGDADETDACAACQVASCGDGFVRAGVEACDDGNPINTDLCSNACELPHRVFQTSKHYAGGAIDGVAGADEICQLLADVQDLDGTFKAWISDTNIGPSSPGRLDTAFTGIYILLDGTIVAEGWTDLTDGSLDHRIDVTEKNNVVLTDPAVWTNTSTLGKPLGSTHCEGWTSSLPMNKGTYGFASLADAGWTDFPGASNCDAPYPLYCFEDPT